jgi:hypothetical protein
MHLAPKLVIWLIAAPMIVVAGYWALTYHSVGMDTDAGQPVDSLNGVLVYANGGINESHGRNLGAEGYNIGIQYQCVEFVKRYYYQRFGHKMPDPYGHAKSFFEKSLPDGALNKRRNLEQFTNGSITSPLPDDIVVFSASILNPYGHVAIISEITPYSIVVVQQNAGPLNSSRMTLPMNTIEGRHNLPSRVLGWLRLGSASSDEGKKVP